MDDSLFSKRVVCLNDSPIDSNGDCVIYWMQRSQRASGNLALKHAGELANDLGKPLLVYFGLFDQYPMGSARAFQFMLEGFAQVASELCNHGIGFVVRREHPAAGVVRAAQELKACAFVVDEDYLKIVRTLRGDLTIAWTHSSSR
jgi:deoxyribodipyrimidine photo-lyase